MTSTLTLPMVSHTGSLEAYIQSVNQFPMLSAEEELSLARDYHRDGNLEAARQLVLCHLRVVATIARGYLGYGLPHSDLIQEGNIGLMKAVKRYDPDRGVRLFSFAVHWIKAEIHEYILRNWRMVRIATTKAQRKLFFNLRSMKKGLNALSPQETQDMAAQLGVKPEEVRDMEMRLAGHDMSLEPLTSDEDSYGPIDYLTDDHDEPSRVLDRRSHDRLQGEGIAQALGELDPRSRRVIEARWLADEQSSTLHELAAEFQVSAERIRQIEVKALQKMKQHLLGYQP